jgi:tRNA modification GTPase
MTSGDTIVALATPYGFSGLAIVRISGPDAFRVTKKATGANSNLTFKHRQASLCRWITPENKPFDDVVVTCFKAPHTYTGENLVEISCHGSPAIFEEIINTACHFGARVAEPGEFTRRAFINGKLDLTQAEAIADLISSQSIESVRLSYKNLQGALSNHLNKMRDKLLKVLSYVEFELDISEEDTHPSTLRTVKHETAELLEMATQLLASHQQGKLLTRGAAVVITGKPNVGKSTLLNALSKTERAITSHIPGTTRDTVDVTLVVKGVPVRLIDTAGVRDTAEPIEAEGVKRTRKTIESADLVLEVIDDPADLNTSFSTDAPVLKILNKIDRLTTIPKIDAIPISAQKGLGLDLIMNEIINKLGLTHKTTPAVMITSARQRDLLQKALHGLKTSVDLVSRPDPSFELISFELRTSLECIDRILGKTTSEEILDTVFGNFCVGK